MPKYTFEGLTPDKDNFVTVEARNEEEARKLAMIERWGTTPDRIIPHAPNYRGSGLTLIKVGR